MSQPHRVKATYARLAAVARKAAKPPDEMTKAFGQRVRIEIDRLGIGPTEFARLASVDQGNLSGFMNGDRGMYAETLVHVLDAAWKAGCDLRFITTGTRGIEVGTHGLSREDEAALHEMLQAHRASKASSHAPPDVAPGPRKKRRKP